MAKGKFPVRIVIYILIVIIAIYLIKKYVIGTDPLTKEGEEKNADPQAPAGSPKPSSSLKRVGNNTTLKRGTKAQEVQWVQYYYNSKIAVPAGKTKLVEDGIFGAKTEAVVKTVTGQNSTTWTNFKAKIDAANNPIAETFNQDNYPSYFPWLTPLV